jgi:hypothetical protein
LVVCPQMFIVKYLIIIFTQDGHIYTQTERRGKGLAAGETERESVCERRRVAANRVGVRCKNSRWKKDELFWVFPEKLF